VVALLAHTDETVSSQVGQAKAMHGMDAGTLLAAAMQGGSRGRWVTGAVESMKQSNGGCSVSVRLHHCKLQYSF
jgi:hypothetical protein